ncbi:MAG: NAD(P)/FAD-dependent oxidoreductase [Weeksellaceae bacterium]|nr:NAD(P)/FAD-dependent oxidoreductase [Weeksellaceae bacterium]
MRIAIIGGGAAGFFLGAQLTPPFSVTIFEKAAQVLQKVRVSGGGRCNVTNATYQVQDLVQNYPRGQKELRSVFSRFQPADTIAWFEQRGVKLKTEDDGRIFPVTDSSSTIIECLINANRQNGVVVQTQSTVVDIFPEADKFVVETREGKQVFDKVCICSGSSMQMWQLVKKLGHTVVDTVPSLFTFNCEHALLQDMQGTVVQGARIQIVDSKLNNTGSMLITHWGLSGPAVIVLSAHAARHLAELGYIFKIQVSLTGLNTEQVLTILKSQRADNPNKSPYNTVLFGFTKRFWKRIIEYSEVRIDANWQNLSDKHLVRLAESLSRVEMEVKGKSTHKEEFVTAGGVSRREINFKTMESKLIPGLYFAGETIDIDAVTGGFNFQACWSEAFVIAEALQNTLAEK